MSVPRPTRNFNCSDRAMLTGGLVLIEAFTQHKATFTGIRTDLADPFATNFQTRINNALTNHLGVTANLGARPSSASLTQARESAKQQVRLLKNTIESRFKSDPAKLQLLLTNTGLTQHYTRFYAGDDESATELLKKFELNLAPASPLRTELTTAGIADTLIAGAISALTPITALNISQETEKQASKSITDEAILEFNQIYSVISDLCQQGQSIFAGNPSEKDKFVWDKIIRGM